MNDEKPTPLFRAEAIRHRTRALFGDVVLAAPLSTWLITGLLLVILVGVTTFGVFGKITTTTTKYQGSIYNPLVPLHTQQKMFYVRSQFGDNTYYFDIPATMASLYSRGETTYIYGETLNGRAGPFPAKVVDIQKTTPVVREFPTSHLLVLRELPIDNNPFPYVFFQSGPYLVQGHNSTPIWRWILGRNQ